MILKKASAVYAEVSRTEDIKLRKNVDILYWHYRNQNKDEILKYCNSEFELFSLAIRIDRSKPDIFIKMMTNAHLNMFDVQFIHQILDAIQAKRPFYRDLFELVFEHQHEQWMNLMKAYYNKRFKELTVKSNKQGMFILRFADLMIKQNKKCRKYGMQDGRFDKALNDLLSTFFTRTFQNMMPLILEVLEKMKTVYTKEKETICSSYGIGK